MRLPFISAIPLLGTYLPKHNSEGHMWDFSGGTGDKNPPASAGGTGAIPGWGRVRMIWSNEAHEPPLLSPCSRAGEPQWLRLQTSTAETCVPAASVPQQEKPAKGRVHAPRQTPAPLTAS